MLITDGLRYNQCSILQEYAAKDQTAKAILLALGGIAIQALHRLDRRDLLRPLWPIMLSTRLCVVMARILRQQPAVERQTRISSST